MPANMPWDQADLAITLPRSKWASYGVTLADGRPLPADSLSASLLLPMGRLGPAFLAYENFQVYLQWNNSLTYSTTAAYLATRIAGAPAMRHGSPPPALPFQDVKEMQTLLVRAGFDVGKIDGFLGLKSRQAVKAMQVKYGLPAEWDPTAELLARMRGGEDRHKKDRHKKDRHRNIMPASRNILRARIYRLCPSRSLSRPK